MTENRSLTFGVEGLTDLDRALGRLPEAWRRPIVLAALRRAAQPIIADARSIARRQTNPTRRGGVRIDSPKGRKWGLQQPMAETIRFRAEGLAATAATEAAGSVGPARGHFYSGWVERGTQAHPSGAARARTAFLRRPRVTGAPATKRGHAATRAFPFMKPAFEGNKTSFFPRFGAELWRSIEAKARSVARRVERGGIKASDVDEVLFG